MKLIDLSWTFGDEQSNLHLVFEGRLVKGDPSREEIIQAVIEALTNP
jgi:hypothetical protein